MALHPALPPSSRISVARNDTGPAWRPDRTQLDARFLRRRRQRRPVDARAGVDASRAAACRSAHCAHPRMRRRRHRGGRWADVRRIPFRLRDLDSTAHQQSLPRQSLHADAGAQRPFSFRRKNRRRDLPDVPGLRRDSERDRWLDRSAARVLSGCHWRPTLSALVRHAHGVDPRSADAGELHTCVDLRRFAARRVHR